MKTRNIYTLSVLLFLNLILAGTINLHAAKDSIPENLTSPFYLSANVSDNTVELSWGTDGPEGSWLSYMTGNAVGVVGLASAGTYRTAIRFTADQLADFVNNPVGKIAWIPNSSFTLYTLNIWTGVNGETLIYSMPLWDNLIGQWNEFTFPVSEDNMDIIIEEGLDYWFGFEMEQFTGSEMSMIFDAGPAVSGSGDLINLGYGWVSMTDYGLNNNWAIQVFMLDMETGEKKSLTHHLPDSFNVNQPNELISSPIAFSNQNFNLKDQSDLLGYNIFRDGVLLNDGPFNNAVFLDTDLEEGIYSYSVTAVFSDGESEPVSRTVQTGAPKLALQPRIISDTLQGGSSTTKTITLSNPGSSQLEWAVETLPSWASLSPANGNLDPQISEEIQLNINTSGLSSGTHMFNIEILTNDFNNVITFLPVVIEIEGESILQWTTDTLSFGNSPLFQNKLLTVGITNLAIFPVYIFNFTTSLPNTAVFNPTWVIQPGETMDIMVSFMAGEAIDYLGVISVQYFDAFGSGTIELNYSATGVIMHPANLSAHLDEEENLVTLSWLPPGASEDILQYGSGENFSAIGTSAGLYEFAARFGAEELMAYTDKQLEKVEFYVFDNAADFTVRIYTGEDALEPLYSLPVNPIAGAWNTAVLPEPLMLASLDHLWITFTTDQDDMRFIAGVDGGPALGGKGDLFRVNNMDWNTLSDYGFPKNWNIRGIVSDIDTGEDKGILAGGIGNPDKTVPGLLGYNVYRNEVQINTELVTDLTFTDEVDPAESNIYGVTAVFEYGESAPATIDVSFPTTLSLPAGWEFNPTPFSHNMHIPADVIQIGLQLDEGDLIGAFYHDNGMEKCAGVGMWHAEHLVVTVFGNNPQTEGKDGFDYNEPVHWKVYLHSSGETKNITAAYDQQMPHHEGTFKMLGLSLIEVMEAGALSGETQTEPGPHLVVFPNPSRGSFSLKGVSLNDEIKIYDTSGRMIMSQKATGELIQLEMESKGVFVIEIRSGDGNLTREKLVIY